MTDIPDVDTPEDVEAPDGPDTTEQVETPDAELPELPTTIDPAWVRSALEAVLFVSDEPVTELTVAQILQVPPPVVAQAVRELAAEYDEGERGWELKPVAEGWRLFTRASLDAVVERFVLDGQKARLTQAALETLSIVAYQQPVGRARIAAVRGVSVDGVLRTLVTRGLVREVATDPSSGATLYGTTPYFLERLGLDSLDGLPPLAPLLPDLATLIGEED
jgi:segregation and condensation protein B